jgi:KDO2-lipid IV(A) lauroyltransferase
MLPPALGLLSNLVRTLPPSFDRPLAAAAGTLWSRLDRARARAVRANRDALGVRFPLHRPFVSYLETLAGWLRLLELPADEVRARTRVTGIDSLTDAARARGVVLIAAHVGEWEWGAAALAARGLPVVAVAGTQMSARWSPALARAKERHGIDVVGPEVSALRLVRALRAGGVVALLVDGDVASALAPAPLAGRTVDLPEGPARLAARTGAALVAGRCERDRGTRGAGHYHVHLEPLAVADVDTHTTHVAVAAWLERTILEDPGRWCVFRPFFTARSAAPSAAAPDPRPARSEAAAA